MTTAPLTADTVLKNLDESAAMWPHNAHAAEDPATELALLSALSKPNDAPMGTPLYRRAGQHSSRLGRLFDAVFGKALGTWSDFDFYAAPCDRCLRNVQPKHSLWIAAGSSVVDVHCCDSCRRELDGSLADLVWQ